MAFERAVLLGALLVSTPACDGSPNPTTCRPPANRESNSIAILEPALGGLTFTKPVQLLLHPLDHDAWIVVEHTGTVYTVRDGRKQRYFDISDRVGAGQQWGLHEIAFHPGFPDDPRIFATYVAKGDVSTVSSFRASGGGRAIDVAAETVLLSEPQSMSHHPIGGLAFGPDGYLYVAWGEGNGKSQRPELLGGKMLRIDVDRAENGRPYAVPRDNPYLGTGFRPEVFAIGFRNPWRFTFDRATGELWLGDVGGRRYEEVNLIEAGANYGWPVWEGTECVAENPARCTEDFAFPVNQHSHAEMWSVTGGYVYHGKAIPALRGRYVYADHSIGAIWALARTPDGKVESEPVMRTKRQIASFAEDREGELYVVDAADDYPPRPDDSMVYKIVPAPARKARSDQSAAPLSSLDCMADGADAEPPGLIAYTINHPRWHEGAQTYRFASPDVSILVYGNQDMLERSRGAILLKNLVVDGRPVETQMLVHLNDGTWRGYDYEWSDDGRDAQPLTRAKTKTLPNGTRWTFPGPDGCARCHNARTGAILGFSLSQMSTTAEGPNQLAWLESRSLFKSIEDGSFEPPPPIPRLDDETVSMGERARAYLHVNCAHCHQPGGNAGEASMDLRMSTPARLMRVCGAPPAATFPGHEDASLIAPGHPERSLISMRMHRTDSAAMPPERHTVDRTGVRVIDEWIRGLRDCPQ